MAWSNTLKTFGVCGNFKFAIYDLTDIKATISLIKPMNMDRVHHVASTNTTDNADVLAGQTLLISETAQVNVTNKIDMNATFTFDPEIDGAQAHNTADNLTSFVTYDIVNVDHLFCHKGGPADAAYDLCPDGNETYTIYSERIVQVLAADANDDGTILVIGG